MVGAWYAAPVLSLRNPLTAVGLSLIVLGAGNWYTGTTKLQQYRGLLAEEDAHEPATDHREFTHLTDAMNTNLLRPLRYASSEYQRTQAKIDFYRVVNNGGRTLVFLGLSCVVIAMILQRRQTSDLRRPRPT